MPSAIIPVYIESYIEVSTRAGIPRFAALRVESDSLGTVTTVPHKGIP